MTENRLNVGDTAPAFALADDAGNTVSLADYAGQRVLVYFYPRANTPGCTKEACDFRDSLEQLNDSISPSWVSRPISQRRLQSSARTTS